MVPLALKAIISAVIIVAVSELSKRSTVFGALLASLPLISVLAMIWLYVDTKDTQAVAKLSNDIVWLVIPSLALFIALPLLLKRGMTFAPALTISAAVTVVLYILTMKLLSLRSAVS